MSQSHDDVPLQMLGWCVGLQLFGTVIGFVGSWYSHSYTLLSDALHWSADVLPAMTTLAVRALIQTRRRNGAGRGFSHFVTASGAFNALTLIGAGGLSVRETTAVIDDYSRHVSVGLALIVAISGLVANGWGHLLTHRYSHQSSLTDSRFDILTLDRHLLIDTLMSSLAIAFILLNAAYRISWWDTAGGLILGWTMVGYGLYLIISGWRKHQT